MDKINANPDLFGTNSQLDFYVAFAKTDLPFASPHTPML
jgi:hypothetical protein